MISVLLACSVSLIVTLLAGPAIIAMLKTFRQPVREYMPKEILAKKTPTMGGVLILLAATIGAFVFASRSTELYLTIFVTIGFALVGLIDDVIKVVLKRPLGLKARQKLIGQIIISLTLVLFTLNASEPTGQLAIPFTTSYLQLPTWVIAYLIVMTLIGASNAVNITDGLDGLAAGTSAITAFVLAVTMVAFDKPDLAIFAGALGGACLGFIWFNAHPAQVIMGDVGALGIGAGLASVAILSQTELYLLLAGGLLVLETLAVMAQVSYFRITKGKRIFKMTPIHYHFHKSGWHETTIVARFTIVAVLFGIIALLALPR